MHPKSKSVLDFLLNEYLLNILGFGILILSIICNYSVYDEYKLANVFNSDSLGIPCLFKDIFYNGGHIKDWYLAAAPALFPDMTLYYVLFLIFKLNFLSLSFVYGLIQTLTIVVLSCYIFRKSFSANLKKYSWLVPVFYSILFLESYYFTNDQFFPSLMLVYCYHTGTLVNTLITVSVLISKIKPVYKFIFIFLFTILATYSDILFIVMFIGPTILTNLFLYKSKGLRYILVYTLTVIFGVCIAMKLYTHINQSGLFNFSSPNKMYAFENIGQSMKTFYAQASCYISLLGFRSFQMVFAYLSPVISGIMFLVYRKKFSESVKFFLLFYTIFSIIVYAAPVLNGSYTGWDTIRYNVAPVFFAMTFLAILVGYFMKKRESNRIFSFGLSYLILIVFFSLITFKLSPKGFVNYFSYYPQKVKEIDSVCVKKNFKRGISNYWIAKWITVFSKNNVQVLSVYPSCAINEVGSNIKWYLTGEFEFVIVDKLDPIEIKKNFIILDTINTPNFSILKVRKFYFAKNEYVPKTKF